MSNSKLKIKTNTAPGSRLQVDIEIPADKCKLSFQEALSRLSRSANLPGFRKGKVPKAVILQQVGSKRVKASALESLLESVWNQAVKEKSIEPLCEPELLGGFEGLLEKFNTEEKLQLTLETDIAPNPSLKAHTGLTAEAEEVKFDPKKVEELIEQSRKQLATLVPIDNRPAKKGDVAVISFKGTYNDDNSEIEGGSSESMDIELEEGKMIPGFIEGIVGMKINEEKTVKCDFPENYSEESARGRKANFLIALKDLKERDLPALDDDFAKQTSDKSSMNELKKELEERLKEDAKIKTNKNRQKALLDVLVKELEVELPKTLIDQEVRNLIEQTARNFAEQGIDVKSTFTQELVNSLMESSRPEAEENLRRNFALNALAQSENIKIDDIELDKKLNEVQKSLEKEKNIDQKKLRKVVLDDLLQEKLFIWLEANNTIIEKKKPAKKQKKGETEDKDKNSKKTKSKSTSKN